MIRETTGPTITKSFYGRTFRDAVKAADSFRRAGNLREITSQWRETAGGWAGTVHFALPALPSPTGGEG